VNWQNVPVVGYVSRNKFIFLLETKNNNLNIIIGQKIWQV
jgi:hypothetical protein